MTRKTTEQFIEEDFKELRFIIMTKITLNIK